MSTLLNGHPVVEPDDGECLVFNNDARRRLSLKEACQRCFNDFTADLEAARNKGKIEEKLEWKIVTALIMKQEGFAASDIADITGLAIDEIEKLN